jgi:hypothetical protein
MSSDLETRSAILFFTLLGLTLVVGVLGISVLIRRAREGPAHRSTAGLAAAITVLLLVVAFLATDLPLLAFLPAPVFFFFALRLGGGGSGLRRDGGIVVGMVGFAWLLYAVYQIIMMDWSKTVIAPIRIDILIVLPAMAVHSFIGCRIPGALKKAAAQAALPRTTRPVSRRAGPGRE